jgi:hypothetical protein
MHSLNQPDSHGPPFGWGRPSDTTESLCTLFDGDSGA